MRYLCMTDDQHNLLTHGLRRYRSELAYQWRNATDPSDLLSEEIDKVEELLSTLRATDEQS